MNTFKINTHFSFQTEKIYNFGLVSAFFEFTQKKNIWELKNISIFSF